MLTSDGMAAAVMPRSCDEAAARSSEHLTRRNASDARASAEAAVARRQKVRALRSSRECACSLSCSFAPEARRPHAEQLRLSSNQLFEN
eukprot:5423618-Pleurochrysis_carterae.AAC.9